MIETLCDYKDGILIDDVFDLIYKVVAEKHQIKIKELFVDDENGDSYNKEQYQDEINYMYDDFEDEILRYLNN